MVNGFLIFELRKQSNTNFAYIWSVHLNNTFLRKTFMANYGKVYLKFLNIATLTMTLWIKQTCSTFSICIYLETSRLGNLIEYGKETELVGTPRDILHYFEGVITGRVLIAR